jgi:glycosyltransferase involved in cell wall biosynthesis
MIYGSLATLSGGYLYDRKLVEFLRSQGDTVEIISLPGQSYASHLMDNLHVRLPANLDLLIQDELNHPSLIVANWRKHPYPVISLVHHLRSSELRPAWQNDFYRMVEKRYLRSVDGFIFNSKTTQGVVNSLVGDQRPSVIAYPPTDRFGPPLAEEEIIERSEADEFRILFLGNVIYRKGLHTLLNAAMRLRSKVLVDVVGSLDSDPMYVRRIRELISKDYLPSRVFLHGSLDREPLVDKLKQAHVLVVPSSYEGFGIVYLEGMAFGLPAIGTLSGAASELIDHGITGYLIEPDDSRSLTQHLISLAEDRSLLRRLSLNARERYLRQPSWTETAKNIRAFLQSFLQ